ncbi:MAG: hypothetical protein PF569_06020 [Candidatus Woesearchaeota archaeon]|jgi:DNA replication initiation complex subunit (GINS family)|nr:hypothetical protein [Candidatus Woesearchaeota archaeon]
MDNQNSSELPLLTYNSLYNLLREEKKIKKLQMLPEEFYESLQKFLKDKKLEIDKLRPNLELRDKLKRERLILSNSQKVSQELINLRCVKISNIAIKNKIFEEDTLSEDDVLEKEKDFFNNVQKGINTITKYLK